MKVEIQSHSKEGIFANHAPALVSMLFSYSYSDSDQYGMDSDYENEIVFEGDPQFEEVDSFSVVQESEQIGGSSISEDNDEYVIDDQEDQELLNPSSENDDEDDDWDNDEESSADSDDDFRDLEIAEYNYCNIIGVVLKGRSTEERLLNMWERDPESVFSLNIESSEANSTVSFEFSEIELLPLARILLDNFYHSGPKPLLIYENSFGRGNSIVSTITIWRVSDADPESGIINGDNLIRFVISTDDCSASATVSSKVAKNISESISDLHTFLRDLTN